MLLVLLDISVYLNFTVFASVIHKGFAVSWVNEQKSQKNSKKSSVEQPGPTQREQQKQKQQQIQAIHLLIGFTCKWKWLFRG